jgi:hypothetical protein
MKEHLCLKGKTKTESTVEAKNQNTLASKKIDIKNKGIGPIKSIQLKAQIDQTMVTHGAELYKKSVPLAIDLTKSLLVQHQLEYWIVGHQNIL